MLARHIASGIGASLSAGWDSEIDITHIYAGDRISDLLAHASKRTLLVTNLTGAHVVRLAEIMELGALCFLYGTSIPKTTIRKAERNGIAIMVSPAGMFETCGRLHRVLGAKE